MIDLFASEYGWTSSQIDALDIAEEAELLHAILYRKGVKTYRKEIQTEQYTVSLAGLRQQREIDTSELEEGISWLLP